MRLSLPLQTYFRPLCPSFYPLVMLNSVKSPFSTLVFLLSGTHFLPWFNCLSLFLQNSARASSVADFHVASPILHHIMLKLCLYGPDPCTGPWSPPGYQPVQWLAPRGWSFGLFIRWNRIVYCTVFQRLFQILLLYYSSSWPLCVFLSLENHAEAEKINLLLYFPEGLHIM